MPLLNPRQLLTPLRSLRIMNTIDIAPVKNKDLMSVSLTALYYCSLLTPSRAETPSIPLPLAWRANYQAGDTVQQPEAPVVLGLSSTVGISHHIKSTKLYIAHWIYTSITHHELIRVFLSPWTDAIPKGSFSSHLDPTSSQPRILLNLMKYEEEKTNFVPQLLLHH